MSSIPQLLATARTHHEAGRLTDAEHVYQQVLAIDPQNAVAVHLCGGVLFQLGRHIEAVDYLKKSVALAPQQTAFYSNLANVCLAAGYADDAELTFRQLLKLSPDDGASQKSLGTLLYRQGKIEESQQHYEAAATLLPQDAEAHNFVGVVLSNQGFREQAAERFRKAAELSPAYVEAHSNLGSELRVLGRYEESLRCFRRAIELKPESADAHNGLGCVYKALGQHESALTEFRETLRLAPEHHDGHNNRGATLVELGRYREAVHCFQKTLTLWPSHAFAWRNLVELAVQGHHQISPDDVTQLQSLRSAENLSPADSSQLMFSLATLFEHQGDTDEAFHAFHEANERRRAEFDRRGRAFTATQHLRAMDHHISVLDGTSIDQIRNSGVDSSVPVFVVGMPRSGTSLVEQILASHPQIYGAGELHDIRKLTEELSELLPGEVGYPDCLLRAESSLLGKLANKHLQRLSVLSGGAKRVVDKMPENYFYLPLIYKLFPNASVIHCRRDPVATCVSCWRRNFDNVRWACDLSDIGFYYTQYERLMSHWQKALPNRILDVDYEELVDDSETVSRKMVAFCGLKWDEECLAFFRNKRAVRTASTLQVRKPIYTTSLRAWERYDKHLGPLFEALGEFSPRKDS